MTEHSPRLFADDAAVAHVGEGLLACTLPREEWTHEAHLAACLWLVRERPDILPERDLPAIIRVYNESVGGVNDDTQGYHETLTQFYIATVRAHDADNSGLQLCASVNALLHSESGGREWPLRHYSRELLFSVQARRKFVRSDLGELSYDTDIS
jgi:hypothetical protein